WVKLGEVCEINMGQSLNSENIIAKNLLYFQNTTLDFHQGKIAFGEKFIKESNFITNNPVKIAYPDSVLLCVRAPVGIVNITKNKIAIGRGLCALKSNFMNNAMLYYILSCMQFYFESLAIGSTFKAINLEIINEA
ncbi:restriction endonuclease subunit S, partial [Campylobacter sp. LR291e]|uniref:restriction endonuclease subunit S n=1 Tax=Campylobacter sp. LR291e TaxID=2593546 RepID=UPI0012724004